MEFQAVKGTRDFYPDAMRVRTWIMDAWRRVSLRNGFEEYDSPIFEYLDLFTIKSGQEIAAQLFNFTDRGGRSLAIRPEITPALGRMVNARINALPRPIKWFSMPRLCRAENPQKGRLREFFQWNIDVIGVDDVIADAECIFTCADLFREVNLTPQDVQIRIGSRSLTVAALGRAGVEPQKVDAVLPILDKRPKVADEEFNRLLTAAGLTGQQIGEVRRFQDCQSVDEVATLLADVAGLEKELDDLRRLWDCLRLMGAGDYCSLDMRIVRGLAYYTGIVYEAFDAGASLRALAGGGRYDNLLQVLGGPKVGATGFGMGDVVLGILLDEKGKLPEHLKSRSVEFFVVEGDQGMRPKVLELVGRLRTMGRSAEFGYKSENVGKAMKEANRRGAANVVIVRNENVGLKDLATGNQQDMSMESFLATLSD